MEKFLKEIKKLKLLKKLTGNKINAAVFISGRGSNLKTLIKYSKSKYSKININLVITNNSGAKGIKYAQKSKIKFYKINYKNKKSAENKILIKLKYFKIDLICLAGFMKILSKKFIKNFKGKILNIHPSLLPKYKGLDTHKKVIENKDKYSGCTVHIVTPKLDSGKIILQKKIKVPKNNNIKILEKRILKLEHQIYPRAIKKFLTNF